VRTAAAVLVALLLCFPGCFSPEASSPLPGPDAGAVAPGSADAVGDVGDGGGAAPWYCGWSCPVGSSCEGAPCPDGATCEDHTFETFEAAVCVDGEGEIIWQ
jgi:hypothetical protein